MRVTAAYLNMRSGSGTSHGVVAVLECGDPVRANGGPSSGWYNITADGRCGWAPGNFLVPESDFDEDICEE